MVVLASVGGGVMSVGLSRFSEARPQGFSPGTPVSSPPSSVNGSANKIKLK